MVRTEKQKMLAGELYHASDPELQADQATARNWMARYNSARAVSEADRLVLLRELFTEVGDGVVVRPPFHCDYGYNIRIGPGVFINFSCIILDAAPVTLGAGTKIGPAVQIYTPDHPRDAAARQSGVEYARSINIGRNVWIGGSAIILSGISIGDDAIIGAGAVVTRHVMAGTTVVGNPGRQVPMK